jgi:hypothetical protein
MSDSGGNIGDVIEMPQNESQQKSEKFITKISDEAERKRGEEVLDEAIENTFPASDPVSAEQPFHAHNSKIHPPLLPSRPPSEWV